MPTLLQIDSCLGIGSTGRITESIGILAKDKGWDCYIAHGARYAGESQMLSIPVVSKFREYSHIILSLLFDNHGLNSVYETKKLIKKIEKIKPDIVQIHCLHGYYINYRLLFEYLNNTNIPVVWTFHDCWAFTGHCAHFVTVNCNRWKEEGCHDCPLINDYPRALIDRSKRNFELKKNLFSANKNTHIVAVSDWLASLAKESFFGNMDIRVINNGIDISIFKFGSKLRNGRCKIIGVATTWSRDKGLFDFYKLSEKLPTENYEILLIGLTKDQVENLPKGIKGITRTESINELAHLYSEADILVNPTYADSFPTVNMEALACGTPVITYKTGGSPEIIDEKTGITVEKGNIDELVNAIKRIEESPLLADDCRARAVGKYNKDDRFMDYIHLYEKLISNK